MFFYAAVIGGTLERRIHGDGAEPGYGYVPHPAGGGKTPMEFMDMQEKFVTTILRKRMGIRRRNCSLRKCIRTSSNIRL